jgi:hypothetical protein
MSNIKTVIDEWSVKDLEDNSSLTVSVISCTELGNQSKPGIQVCFMGTIINYEPVAVERLVYLAGKAGVTEYLLEEYSWMVHENQYVKNYLVLSSPLMVKVEVKTRSSKPIIKTYSLPFEVTD